MIELKHLRTLNAVSRHGSISAAARELGYSQPAISQQIQAVERHLRTPVLIRGRRGIRLSEAGEVLVRHGEQMLRAMAAAEAEVEAVVGLRAATVRIASFDSAAGALLPQTFAAIKAEHPGVAFEMVEVTPEQALSMLREGKVDLAMVYHHEMLGKSLDRLELTDEEILTPVLDERVHVALPPSHPLAARRWVEVADLAAETWIAGCPVCRSNLMNVCASAGFEPVIGFETDDYLALHQLAAQGLGIALVPELMHTVLPSRGSLEFRLLDPLVVRHVGVVTFKGLRRVPAVARTVSGLVASGRELGLHSPHEHGPSSAGHR
ncbi:LysR family transcriptional regulator [Streptomyces sp. NBRC 110028]|uniref:LysR family transcriptional regulator n=1 Tax=Streptomyces sp. NBRC 110028 TaxID=1621260 RepID=UPI0006E19513|nr:LysR family transcriptional regulator [Streptomyces sp. NBRC 110028]